MAKDGAARLRSPAGRLLLVVLIVLALPVGGGVFLLHAITHPRRDRAEMNPEDLLLRVEDVAFEAADGVMLSGWFVKGPPGGPAIILCHDLGGSRQGLLQSAVSLNRAGFPLFMFDFRGHGQSGGRRSSLGVAERHDLLGAVAFLKGRKDIDPARFGVWGVGMGAHAAALAAAETPEIAALALDGVYPDVPVHLDRLVKSRIPPALHFLVPGVRILYNPYFMFALSRSPTVSGTIETLADRDLLFIAAADAPERQAETRALYAALPDHPSGDRNFLELRASGISGLYAEDKKKYDESLVRFFKSYLSRAGRPAGRQEPIQVLER
jgi:pimeloyl-ACP methyl ester carboxylesterase